MFKILIIVLSFLISSFSYADNDPKRVIVSGTGGTRELALNNAFRHAVEQAVGMRVSSETMVKNIKVIQDDILLSSNGFIESYDVIDEASDITGVAITISAVVRDKKLTDAVKIATGKTFDVGSDVYANFSLGLDKADNYKKVIDTALSDFLKNGIEYKYETMRVADCDGGYCLQLGGVTMSLSPYWIDAMKKYRDLLGSPFDEEAYARYISGTPSIMNNYGKNSVDQWFRVTINLLGDGDLIGSESFVSSYYFCRLLNDFNQVKHIVYGKDSNRPDKMLLYIDTGGAKYGYGSDKCRVSLGPYSKSDLMRLKKVEFSVDYSNAYREATN